MHNMGTASLQFLGFGLAVVIVFNLSRAVVWRQLVLLIANLLFLSFFSHSPTAWIPFAGFLTFGYLSLRLMQSGKGTSSFLALVTGGIAAFIWLKKYTFIPSGLFLSFPYVTLGLSYIFFRVLHLIIDARNQQILEPVSLFSYLNYTLNFTTLISGPIQRYQDFAKCQLATVPLELDIIVTAEAMERIIARLLQSERSLVVAVDAADQRAKRAGARHKLPKPRPAGRCDCGRLSAVSLLQFLRLYRHCDWYCQAAKNRAAGELQPAFFVRQLHGVLEPLATSHCRSG